MKNQSISTFLIFLCFFAMIAEHSSSLLSFSHKKIKRSHKKQNHKTLDTTSTLSKDLSKRFSFEQDDENISFMETGSKVSSTLSVIYEGYLTISSNYFVENNDLPNLYLESGEIIKYSVEDENLINKSYKDTADSVKEGLNKLYFYGRINKDFLYFTANKSEFPIVFYINVSTILEVKNMNTENNCYSIETKSMKSKNNPKFVLCALKKEFTESWVCLIDNLVSNNPYENCLKEKDIKVEPKKTVVIQKQIKQPLLIIPQAQPICNQKWDYSKNGDDWECMCKDSKEQSPINLPKPEQAKQSSAKPLFDYDIVNTGTKKLNIIHENGLLKIKADTDELLKSRGFGRLVTTDGTVYYANEIIFHTPSEHTINGKIYPMEVQIIHEAKSKGDYGKKAILSVLFEGKPGIYNKFIEDIEFFNLPNPHEKPRELKNKLFIPNLLLNIEDSQVNVLNPFSFYTYQGSIPFPPCSENVIHYVVSDPIPASTTSLELFKEALRMPDFEDSLGNIVLSPESIMNNNRNVQPIHGRTVFIYDQSVFNLKTSKKIDSDTIDQNNYDKNGHYEKQSTTVTEYIMVEGQQPSNIPGAIVVPESEGKLN